MNGGSELPAAVLWDMDGLLVDSEPLWTVAESELCTRLGTAFTPDLKAAMIGHRLDAAVAILLAEIGVAGQLDAAVIAESLLVRMVELFSERVPFRPGAVALLRALVDTGVPNALVSSSYRVLMEPVLREVARVVGDTAFVVTVAGDEVTHAKPHPEPFATAVNQLAVSAAECVVLEDSAAGIQSAIAAGCQALLVPSVAGVAEFGAAAGWRVRASLVGLTPAEVWVL